ncbi:DUF1214 domain-containing protein [Streptomyces sp. NPDC059629]|uniref:DUF1214 domain-containing protein n=1 Tax=Streptomyces sp. NPDC059629 TaxID=3346889 RepID=UPI0036898B4B
MDDWRGEYAYTLGEQAFVYGFPYVYNARLRHDWVTRPRSPSTVPYAPVNHFWHAERLLDASYRDGGCPNNDTLYSAARVNLGSEPVILSRPDMGDRYFTFELVGVTSDNFDYVGQRTTGSGAGDFALVGPTWQGELPARVRRLKKAPSPWVLVLGRTQMGRFGDDFLKRAADQSLIGVAANDPAEAVYLLNFEDADGNKLAADRRYELRFPAAALPPVDAFWSLTAYGEDMNLLPNPADRYSVGDRSADLWWDADGGLTSHLQNEPPDQGREANWLPTAKEGAWFVALRMYRPRAEVIDATWECPPLTRVA